MVFIYIFLYFIALCIAYVLIINRLKTLSDRHMKNTWIESLSRWYRIIRRRMIILFPILFILITLVLITFFSDELLFKVWLYNDQETLDNTSF